MSEETFSAKLRELQELLDRETQPSSDAFQPWLDHGEIGGFRGLEELSPGGFGLVFRARDDDLRRDVAIKLLELDSPGARARLEREKLIASVRHDHILRLDKAGTQRHPKSSALFAYLQFELVPNAVPIHHVSGFVERLGAVGQLLNGLKFLHQHGVLHRDLHPGNVIVGETGGARILDTGLSTVLSGHDHLTNPVRGRYGVPPYRAPEDEEGSKWLVGRWTDVYSVGQILRALFEDEQAAGASRRFREFSGKSATELDRIICRCEAPPPPEFTTHDPPSSDVHRYRDAEELLRDWSNWVDLLEKEAGVVAPPESARAYLAEAKRKIGELIEGHAALGDALQAELCPHDDLPSEIADLDPECFAEMMDDLHHRFCAEDRQVASAVFEIARIALPSLYGRTKKVLERDGLLEVREPKATLAELIMAYHEDREARFSTAGPEPTGEHWLSSIEPGASEDAFIDKLRAILARKLTLKEDDDCDVVRINHRRLWKREGIRFYYAAHTVDFPQSWLKRAETELFLRFSELSEKGEESELNVFVALKDMINREHGSAEENDA